MTRLRRLLISVAVFATVDAIIHYRLVIVAMLIGGSIATALVAGAFLDGRDRYEAAQQRQVDELARARARRDRHDEHHGRIA